MKRSPFRRSRLTRKTPLSRTGWLSRSSKLAPVGKRKKRHKRNGVLFGELCERVRAMECCVPGCRTRPVDPHHVRSTGAGWLDRLPDGTGNVTPICRHHHTGAEGVHVLGPETWYTRFGVDLAALAAEIGETG